MHHLQWSNLDELSSLWAVLTKCKRNLKDGCRLENLSWRIWYRHAIMMKQTAPNTASDLAMPTSVPLTRTRSLPTLCAPTIPDPSPSQENCSTERRSKFYIDQSDSEEEEEEEFSDDDEWDMDSSNTASSSDFSFEEDDDNDDNDDDHLEFGKYKTSLVSKPQISILSTMLQQNTPHRGLRRCQSRYHQLAQLVSS
ncbi:hypothetical protein EC973_006377 [Apophysomyces ossiformis]|uniref:Nitrogen regulatory protein areA GATA-like domain-containing protein n=1 Tax=Apophysomyces ossiformis TaxID=679940 RepID=A0A8H7EVG2_9FUNG|nr:hypothetical protein EC973_006377 [Apophysomyces ossiformis]